MRPSTGRGRQDARPSEASGVSLMLRIDLQPGGRVGPGKIALLERIEEHGSISAAARTMRMSYRHAWELVDEVARCFGRPVVIAQMGGAGGGGTRLTPLGRDLVTEYRAIRAQGAPGSQAAPDAAPVLASHSQLR